MILNDKNDVNETKTKLEKYNSRFEHEKINTKVLQLIRKKNTIKQQVGSFIQRRKIQKIRCELANCAIARK